MSRKITFKSLRRNTTYVLTISDGSNTIVNLTPSATPFTTDIDNSEDFFAPVRAQSGTIEIVGEVSDVEPLLSSDPASRLVTLQGTEGNTTILRWKGYLQTAALSQTWDKGPIPLSFPVVSHLGIIESYNFEEAGYISFAAFMKSMNECTGTAFYSSFVFPNLTTDSTKLKYCFSGQAFAKWDEKTLTFEYSNYKIVLEEICKLFGWVAIEVADQLCFLAPDSNAGYIQFTAAQITTLAGGGTATGTSITQSQITENIFGADHTIDYLPGKKSVKVSSTPGNGFGNLFNFDVSNLEIRTTEEYNRAKSSGSSEYLHYFTKNYGDSEEIDVTFTGNIRYDNFYWNNDDLRNGSCCVTDRQLQTDSNNTPNVIEKDTNWINHIICKCTYDGYDNIFSINPTREHFASGLMSEMYIVIKFSVKKSDSYSDDWEAVESWGLGMKVMIGSTTLMDGTVMIKNGTPYYGQAGYANSDGCVAVLAPTNISGQLHIQFNFPASIFNYPYVSFENLSVSYARVWRRHLNTPDDENTTQYEIGNGFTDSLEQSNKLTTQRPEYPNQQTSEQIGWGLVLNDSLSPIMRLYGNKYPEDALAERMRDHYSVSKKRITAQLLSTGGLFNPLHLHTPGSGSGMVCLSQSVNWRDDQITASLFEI